MTPQYILAHDSGPAQRESQIENMGYAREYAEPGYQNPRKGILFADWNCFSKRVSAVLERAGYAIEWSDEWTTCEDCGNAVRTSGNCYGWQPYYVDQQGIVCLDCVDWADYLESIEDNADMACMAQCNPADYGYVLVSQTREYESGLHVGMDDKPADILKRLHAKGKRRLVFRIDETSQFYITFEVWQKIRVIEDWILCSCCGYRAQVEACLLDSVTEQEFERAFVCGDCAADCLSPAECWYKPEGKAK